MLMKALLCLLTVGAATAQWQKLGASRRHATCARECCSALDSPAPTAPSRAVLPRVVLRAAAARVPRMLRSLDPPRPALLCPRRRAAAWVHLV